MNSIEKRRRFGPRHRRNDLDDGIAGLNLCGGGWLPAIRLRHRYLSGDLVTADGDLLTAGATQNEDLFWALRGAGHNFGVVTSFEYRLHRVGPVLGGMVIHPFQRATEVLRFYRDFTSALPDELTTSAGLLTGPDGDLVVAVAVCFTGDLDQGERVLAPLRRFGSPVADTIAPCSYVTMQTMLDSAFPPGRLNYWKSSLTDQLSDEVISAIVDSAGRMSPLSVIVISDYHGAYRRVGKTDTAYYHRDLQYDIIIAANWTDPADSDRNVRWARELFQALQPHVPRGVRGTIWTGTKEWSGSSTRTARTINGSSDSRPSTIKQLLPHEPEHPVEARRRSDGRQ